MDREAFDKLTDADKLWTIMERLIGVEGRADDIAEMLLTEIVEDAFPEPQGSA